MQQINNGYKDFYFLDYDKIWNNKSKKYLTIGKDNNVTMIRTNGKPHHCSINTIIKLVNGSNYAIDNIEDLPNEQWKQIKSGYPYFCSNMGRIKSNCGMYSILLKQDNSTEYPRVKLNIGDGAKNYKVHIIVAFLFLEQPKEPFMDIHHIDCNKQNAQANNLCYLSREEHAKIHSELRKKEKEQNEQEKNSNE